MQQAPLEPQYLTVKQSLQRWGCKRTKFYELLRSNAIEAVKLGARTLVNRESGDRYFENLPPVFPK